MQKTREQSEITKKAIRQQIDASLTEVLANLHIQTKSKKVQKLIEKTSKKLANRVMKSLRKKDKAEKKLAAKAEKKKEATVSSSSSSKKS